MDCSGLHVNIFNPQGFLIAAGLTGFESIDYQRSRNEVGAFELVVPGYDLEFGPDYILEIHREVLPGVQVLDGETCWFVRKVEIETAGRDGVRTIVSGHDTMGLLSRRIIAWGAVDDAPEGFNGKSYKTEPADLALYHVFSENFGVNVTDADQPLSVSDPFQLHGGTGYNADGKRREMAQPPVGLFFQQPATNIAPVIVQEISWQNALQVMQTIASDSEAKGATIWFDIVYQPGINHLGTFTFQVWTPLRGTKRPQVFLSLEYGNLIDAKYTQDWTDECTWAHVGGTGDGTDRIIAGVVDTETSRRSPFYPIECFVDSADSEITTDISLIGQGVAALQAKRPLVRLEATLLQEQGSLFGLDYKYGDIVQASAFGRNFEAKIEQYHYHLDRSGCSLEIPFVATET